MNPSNIDKNKKGNWHDLIPRLTTKRLIKTVGFFLYVVAGCLFYHLKEGWDVRTTLFFTVVTISTVGYGYEYPTTDSSRIFTIFYLIIGVYMIYFYIAKELGKAFNAVVSYIKSLHSAERGEEYNYHRRVMAFNVLAMVLCILIGAGILNAMEPEWTFVTALYMAVQTSSTVGFGDITLRDRTRPFLSFYIIFSSVLAACAFNNFTLMQAEKKYVKRLKENFKKQQSFDILRALDDGSGKGVTESEFILAVLKHLGTISEEKDIAYWREKFKEIDPDGDGKVYSDDIGLFSSRQVEAARTAEAAISAFENKTLATDLKHMATTALERIDYIGAMGNMSGNKADSVSRESNLGTELPTLSKRFKTTPIAVSNPIQSNNNNDSDPKPNNSEDDHSSIDVEV